MLGIDDKVKLLAEAAREAYLKKDPRLLNRLFHDGLTRREIVAYHRGEQRRMDRQYEVSPCEISVYSQPDWEIFKDHRFHPEPTHAITIRLRPTTGGESEVYLTCAPAGDAYKLCYYVHRDADRSTPPETPPVIELAQLPELLQAQLPDAMSSLLTEIGSDPVGFFRLTFSFEFFPTSIDLGAGFEELTMESLVDGGCAEESINGDLISRFYTDLIDGAPALITPEGESIDLTQDRFASDYPNWSGEARLREGIKRCLAPALADAVSQAERERKFTWLDRRAAIVVCADECDKRREMRQTDTINDIPFYEVMAKNA